MPLTSTIDNCGDTCCASRVIALSMPPLMNSVSRRPRAPRDCRTISADPGSRMNTCADCVGVRVEELGAGLTRVSVMRFPLDFEHVMATERMHDINLRYWGTID